MTTDDPTATKVRLCSTSDIAPGEAKRFDVGDHRLAVIRIEDDFYVIGDECSHADYSLAEGEVDADDRTIECWKHGTIFSLESGEPLTLPATENVPVYEIEMRGDDVMVVVP